MKNLIVCDEDYETYKTKIAEIDCALEERLAFIIEQLQYAYNEAFDGLTFHKNLGTFITYLQSMQGQLYYLTNKMSTDADRFVEEIDVIDDIVY